MHASATRGRLLRKRQCTLDWRREGGQQRKIEMEGGRERERRLIGLLIVEPYKKGVGNRGGKTLRERED